MILFIFRIRLRRIGFYRGWFVQVCIWYGQLWVFYCLHKILTYICNLDFLLCGWVGDSLIVGVARFARHVRCSFCPACFWLLLLLIKSSIPISLVFIKVLLEGLDVWNLVPTAVIASRGVLCGGMSICYAIQLVLMYDVPVVAGLPCWIGLLSSYESWMLSY